MKINKIKSTELLGYFDYPITVTLQLVYHKHTYTCRIQILNVTTTNISAKCAWWHSSTEVCEHLHLVI